jgi:hypothetical protein
MSAALAKQIHDIRQMVRRLTIARAIALWLAASLTAALCIGIVDFGLRTEDAGTRWIFWFAWLLVAGYAARRWVWPVLSSGLTDIETAQRIERTLPELRSLLSSSVAFLSSSDPRAGSSRALEQAVIAQATQAARSMDLPRVIDRRSTRTALSLAGTLLLIVLGCSLLLPAHTSAAANRLFKPWRMTPWPTQHHLQFASLPAQVARGDNVIVHVEDRSGSLPARVELSIQDLHNDSRVVERRVMRHDGNTATYELVGLTDSLRIRATGGDDRYMPWHTIAVVDAPEIVDLRLLIAPPDYTSWPIQEWSPPSRLLAGSRLTLTGGTSKPIRGARARWISPGAAEETRELRIRTHGRSFGWDPRSAPLVIEESGRLEIMLSGRENGSLELARRMDIHTFNDSPPEVSIIQPSQRQDVGIRGVVPIEWEASDDVGIARVELRYHVTASDEEPQTAFVALESGQPTAAEEHSLGTAWRKRWMHILDIGMISGIASPSELECTVRATDLKGQESVSSPLRIRILGDSDLRLRMSLRESAIADNLRASLGLQRQARREVETFRSLSDVSASRPDAVDRLRTVQSLQQRVRQRLFDANDSTVRALQQLLHEARNNRLESGELARQTHSIVDALESFGSTTLADCERLLRDLVTSTPAQSETEWEFLPAVVEQLSVEQARAVASLEQIAAQFDRVEDLRELARNLVKLRDQQSELQGQTEAAVQPDASPARSTARDRKKLLAELARRQLQLAQAAEKAAARIEQIASSNTADAQVVQAGAALRIFRGDNVVGRMRQAAAALDKNQPATSAVQQSDIVASLWKAHDALLGSSSEVTFAPSAWLDALADLRQRQSTLLTETARFQISAAAREAWSRRQKIEAARLAEEQELLVKDTQKIGETLSGEPVVEWAVRAASFEMANASQLLRKHEFTQHLLAFQQNADTLLQSILRAWQEQDGITGATDQVAASQAAQVPASHGEDARSWLNLIVLTNLQQLVHDQTAKLEDEHTGANSNSDRLDRLRVLAIQQGQLAELVERLVATESATQANPNSDIRSREE